VASHAHAHRPGGDRVQRGRAAFALEAGPADIRRNHRTLGRPAAKGACEDAGRERAGRVPAGAMSGASAAPKAQVLRLADMAAYQDGAVVSRQVVRAETGNVTLFAFDSGQELSEHTAPFDALVHVIDGAADISIAGQLFRLSAGDAIVLPAGQPHAVKAVSPFKMLLTMIRA
jgi:quercetin dioxygenase-like cupin family protein